MSDRCNGVTVFAVCVTTFTIVTSAVVLLWVPYDNTVANNTTSVNSTNETDTGHLLNELLDEVASLREELAMVHNSTSLESTVKPTSLFDPRVSPERSPLSDNLSSIVAPVPPPSKPPAVTDDEE